MLKPDLRISLADLSAVGVRLNAAQAVSLVRELALRVTRGELPGVPSAHVLRLSSDGGLFVEGPVAADDRAVVRAAHLLETLLPGFDAPPGFRVPGALRLVIARALGTLDVPAYASLQAFAEALERFGRPDPVAVVRALFASWSASVESPAAAADTVEADDAEALSALPVPIAQESARQETNVHALARQDELTISDIRRARRATGLTLGEVARRSRIPVWLLRELEWGYLRNWPGGLYGRTQLLRYARGAGLDGELVINTVWPMLQDNPQQGIEPATMAFGDEPAIVEVTVVPVLSEAPLTVGAPITAEPERVDVRRNARRNRWLAALAVPALIAIGVVPALWYRDSAASVAPATEITANAKPADTRPTAAIPQRRDENRESPAPVAEQTKTAAAARKETSPVALGTSGDDPHPQRGIPDGPAYSPAFASVGSAMFYHSDEDGHASLMRADTDSRGAVLRITSVVDDTARNFHARPSPDGTRIAFDSDREGERAVYVADSDGANVRRVSGEGFAAIPSWSPDGTSLAYVRAEDANPKVWNLWISDLESGRTRRVTSFKYGQPWGGSWFPDGRRIAFSHEDRLFIRDLATGRERVFKSPVKGRLVRTPAVSPDGRRIIFQVMREGTWLLDVPDGSMRKILSDPSAEEYTWAPDGRRVAYHSRRSGDWGVWVMAAR